jgi:hypothetical protein
LHLADALYRSGCYHPQRYILVGAHGRSVVFKRPSRKSFAARLDANLVVKGKVVIPAGSKVYGRIEASNAAGRAFGQSKLALSLRKIVVDGRPVAIATGNYEESGARSGRKTARRTAAGALIGFAAGGPAVGAAIGAASGLIGKGKSVEMPAGTLFEFRLTRPVSV